MTLTQRVVAVVAAFVGGLVGACTTWYLQVK
jgi:hypothetical protein